MFAEIKSFKNVQEVTLGDVHVLEATGEGIVQWNYLKKQHGSVTCTILLVPKFAYNLLNVLKAAEAIKFNKSGCKIISKNAKKVTAKAKRVGNLYYLECKENQSLNVVVQSKERLWHRRYGHLGKQSVKKLEKGILIKGLVTSLPRRLVFTKLCIGGKHQKKEVPYQ